jgi:hypothetical protein
MLEDEEIEGSNPSSPKARDDLTLKKADRAKAMAT